MGTRGTPTLRVFALVVVAMMVSAISHAPRSIVGASDPAQAAKLDQDLAALFNKLEPAYRLIETDKGKIEQAGDRMRVVVNLIRPAGMSLRERGYDALPEVNAAGKLSVDRVVAQLPAGRPDDRPDEHVEQDEERRLGDEQAGLRHVTCSTTISMVPITMRSPFARACRRTRCPLTAVPFVDPRSTTK